MPLLSGVLGDKEELGRSGPVLCRYFLESLHERQCRPGETMDGRSSAMLGKMMMQIAAERHARYPPAHRRIVAPRNPTRVNHAALWHMRQKPGVDQVHQSPVRHLLQWRWLQQTQEQEQEQEWHGQ